MKFFSQTGLSLHLIPTMRKPNAKERILEAASKLFHERGYSEIRINEIIDHYRRIGRHPSVLTTELDSSTEDRESTA
ncbi:hypothetical protein N9X25_04320 [Verrucomicrobiales bacterium]|nr:hypothetical protein [Verrucomicrobiales bacterium]